MQVSRIILRGAALLGLALAITLGALAAGPSLAGAQEDPPPEGYDGYDGYDGEDEGYDGYDGEDDGDTGDETAAPPPSGGTLPMTGAPTLLAGAVVVAGVGIAIRRFSTV